MNIPTLRSERLSLVPLQDTDAAVLHRIYQSEGVLRYFPNPVPPPLKKVKRFIAEQADHWEKYGYGNWGILLAGGNQIAGWAGLQYLPELHETEAGFLLDKPFWGLGYASEAARLSLEFAARELQLDHIIALVHPENLASRRVIEKNGFLYAETIHLWGIDLMRYCKDDGAS